MSWRVCGSKHNNVCIVVMMLVVTTPVFHGSQFTCPIVALAIAAIKLHTHGGMYLSVLCYNELVIKVPKAEIWLLSQQFC